MNLNLPQSLLMGLVSGFAEMLPVSAEAHRTILRTFFGVGSEDAVFRLLVHLAALIVLNVFYSNEIMELRRANYLMKIPPRRRKKPLDPSYASMAKLLRSAVTVMVVCRLFTLVLSFIGEKLNLLPAALIVNGILLLIPSLVRSGNMTSRNMPKLFGWLMGFGAGLGVVPGISPVGAAMSLGQWQGVDRSYSMKFAHILLVPALGVEMVFDMVSMFMGGAAAVSGIGLLIALIGAAASGFAAYWGLKLMHWLAKKSGFTIFAYYSWGAALLCFTLFLMI